MSTISQKASLLIELGTEDLPMQSVATLAEHVMRSVEAALVDDGFKGEADERETDGYETGSGQPKTFQEGIKRVAEKTPRGELGISGKGSEWFATPRRLAFRIKDLPSTLPEKDVERKGPTLEAALDADGKPNAAGLGFAKSCGVEFEALECREGRLYFQGRVAGASLADRVEHHLQGILAKAPMSKRMRWGDESYEFVRPLRWLLALHGEELLEIEVMGIKADKDSYGHRAYCKDPIAIDSAESGVYEDTLREEGKVIASLSERTKTIAEKFAEWGGYPSMAEKVDRALEENPLWVEISNCYDSPFYETVPIIPLVIDGRQYNPPKHGLIRALLAFAQERAAMTEWPDFIIGQIDVAGFEKLRPALLIQALTKSQHFLLKLDADGKTSEKPLTVLDRKASKEFLAVVDLDTDCTDKEKIRHNLERIACARIADAVFFYNKDLEAGLAPLQKNLHKVTFHRALGSLADKSQRIAQLSKIIVEMIQEKSSDFDVDMDALQKAVSLCKLDLLSDTVREYPALQGEVGGWLIVAKDLAVKRFDTKNYPVATIVTQHYMPHPGSSFLPTNREGLILALADRIDTLTGIFGSGEQPTGSKDPYALRRASIAMIQLILCLGGRENDLGFPPSEEDSPIYPKIDIFTLIEESSRIYKEQKIATFTDEAIQAVKDYFVERIKHYYLSATQSGRFFSTDYVAAAIAVRLGDVIDFDTRIYAIALFYGRDRHGWKMLDLIAANKRINNILRKNQESLPEQTVIQEDVLEEGAERELYERVQSCNLRTKKLIKRKHYETMLELMHDELVQPLDDFFDKVMVIAEDWTQRQNRLLLLQQVQDLFMQVGDLSKLHVPGEDDGNS